MKSIQSYELTVVGLGLLGSSTLYAATQLLGDASKHKNPVVLGLEQFDLLHQHGSSHGESRITRQAIGEGADYVSLAIKSQTKMQALQAHAKEKFGNVCYETNTGVLVIGSTTAESVIHNTKGFLQTTQRLAIEYQIPHVNLTCDELKQSYPQFKFKDHEAGYLEKAIGIMNPEGCVNLQIHLAQQANAEVRTQERVIGFEKLANGKIQVTTTKTKIITNKLILTAGAWTPNFLAPIFQEKLAVHRQTLFYFTVDARYREKFLLGNFPPFIWDLGKNKCMYGFPLMHANATALKIGAESYLEATTPMDVNRHVSDEEINAMYETYIKPNLIGILPSCQKAIVCLYTQTPDSQFLIDYLPGFEEQILFASACSGHGAKHALALGEALAQQILFGKSDENILKFNLAAMCQRAATSPAEIVIPTHDVCNPDA